MLSTPGIGKTAVAAVKKSTLISVADSVDLLHYVYTVILIAIFAIISGSGMMFGQPIQCIIEAEIDRVRGWAAYILGYCYVTGTSRSMKQTESVAREDRVDYYQWLPLFFCFQIFCFRFLHFFWLWLQTLLYIDVKTILIESQSLTNIFDSNQRQQKARQIAEYLWSYFYFRKWGTHGWQRTFVHPSVLTWFSFLMKLINLFHVLMQLLITTRFLGFNGGWTVDILLSFFTNDPPAYEYFPHKVFCSYKTTTSLDIRDGHTRTSDCFLTINEYNEKILLVLWIWLLAVSCSTFVNLIYFSRFFTEQMASSLVGDLNTINKTKFGNEIFLSLIGSDGLLIMDLISSRHGSMTSVLILQEMWIIFENCDTKHNDYDHI